METEIDPLSMLEQTMQINDYSVTSNGDEDVVCLTDELEDSSALELPDLNYCQTLDSSNPIVLGTMPNGAAILDPARNGIAFVVDSSQQLHQNMSQDETFSFGEHFLINPGPSSSILNNILTDNCNSSPKLSDLKTNSRNRGSRGGRNIKTYRSKRGGKTLNMTNGNYKKQINSSSKENGVAPTSISNNKLVSNVKRLTFSSHDEQTYRYKVYNELQKVLKSKLDCSVCGVHLGCYIDLNIDLITHPLLKVICCTRCRDNYCNTDWTLGPGNKDLRCRWCSLDKKRVKLKICTNCPFAFCENCIVRNYSKRDCNRIIQQEIWLCFVCQMVPLYYMRATCWALGMFITNLRKRKCIDTYKKDMSTCCNSSNTTIELDDDDDYQIVPDPDHAVSCYAVSSRIDVLFSGIETIKNSMKLKLGTSVEINNLEELVCNLNMSLAKIGHNVESCMEYIENWRLHSLEQHKKDEANKVEEEKKKARAKQAVSGTKKLNGSKDYSYLLKKFNIKPCSVLLERVNTHIRKETSQPPSFFLSLIPSTSEDISIIEDNDDTDDEIICLDD